MLSFLHEQGLEDPSAQKPATAGEGIVADSAGTPKRNKERSGTPEETQEQEYLTVAAQDKNACRSTMLLAVLFGIGLLCLWFMIKKSTPPTASAVVDAEEAQIEMAITRLTGVRSEMFNRMDQIVKKFYEFSDVLQVRVNELEKNPFKHEVFLGNLKQTADTEGEGDLGFATDLIRQQQLRQQTKNLQLLSIIATDAGNCCIFDTDDKIFYEGDSIGGFKVIQISDSFVKLEWEGDPICQTEQTGPDLERNKRLLGTQIILKLSE